MPTRLVRCVDERSICRGSAEVTFCDIPCSGCELLWLHAYANMPVGFTPASNFSKFPLPIMHSG